MKYCLFEDGDVVGPFEAEQLMLRPGFGPERLVCPEEYSDEEGYWKAAACYEEFSFSDTPEPSQPAVQPEPSAVPSQEQALLMSELKRAASEFASVTVPAAYAAGPRITPAQNSAEPALENTPETPKVKTENTIADTPKEPASSTSPIEEYFNTIREGDLGNILGIPDPKENSDMNLARVMESQFEKTDPSLAREIQEDPFDSFSLQENNAEDPALAEIPAAGASSLETDSPALEEQKDLAAVAENTAIPAPEIPALSENNLSIQEADVPATSAENIATTERPEADLEIMEEENLSSDEAQKASLEEAVKTNPTVRTILEGKLEKETEEMQEITEPIHTVPKSVALNAPSQELVADAGGDKLPSRHNNHTSRSLWTWLSLFLGGIILAIAFWLNLKQNDTTPSVSASVPSASPVQPAPVVSKKTPVPAAPVKEIPAAPVSNPLQVAETIIKQYQLSGGRGTIEDFLASHYAAELASGYNAAWSAEPLHQDSYVVKYRLSKTRKEPIVYIFQVNTAKKKLTGALNNITLDLVGKIN